MSESATLSRPVKQEPCKIRIGFNGLGMVMFECATHSTMKETTQKIGEHEVPKFDGERLGEVCAERLRQALKKLIDEAPI